jgi:hypothetical protein
MKTQTTKTIDKDAVIVAAGLIAGLTFLVKVPGVGGWGGGLAMLTASEVHRRKERVGIMDTANGAGRWLITGVGHAARSLHTEARDTLTVYDNVAQRVERFTDHGVGLPELDIQQWISNRGSFRSFIIAGLPGEGKTHLFKAFIAAILETYPERYLKICTTDRGLSHDDEKPETWLHLPDHFFADTIDDILDEVHEAYLEVEKRYEQGRNGDPVSKHPYFLFVDELLVVLLAAKLTKEQKAQFDQELIRILVGGPKARVWIIGASQQLDCGGTGISQATFKLFEFLMLPVMGSDSSAWRNICDAKNISEVIETLSKAPDKAPKPIGVKRGGKVSAMMLPRIHLPDAAEVIEPENEFKAWAESWQEFIDKCLSENSECSPTTAYQMLCDVDSSVRSRMSKDNPQWIAFRDEFTRRKQEQ